MTPTHLPVQAPPQTTASQVESAESPDPAQPAKTDFLLMLGQLVGADTQKTAVATSGAAVRPQDAGDDESSIDAAELAEFLAMFSVPLSAESPAATGAGQSSALPGISADALQARLPQVATQARLLTQLLQSDQPAGDDSRTGPDSLQLPMTATDPQQLGGPAPASDAVLSRPVHQPVGSAAWADEIGSRVLMLADNGRHTASLRLSPEHLGPLEIRVAIRDDQASVWFGAAHADTRAAIENALPRLRELFAAQGLSLADTGVFREPPKEHYTPPTRYSSSDSAVAASEIAPVSVAARVGLGLVDAYA